MCPGDKCYTAEAGWDRIGTQIAMGVGDWSVSDAAPIGAVPWLGWDRLARCEDPGRSHLPATGSEPHCKANPGERALDRDAQAAAVLIGAAVDPLELVVTLNPEPS